jgi:hypothetical protein
MSCLSPSVDRVRCQKLQRVCEDAEDATDHGMYRVWFWDGVRGELQWRSTLV